MSTQNRLCSRIREELPAVSIAESSIRRYVREWKIELGLVKHETFIPQSYAWGQEAQVDWYEYLVRNCAYHWGMSRVYSAVRVDRRMAKAWFREEPEDEDEDEDEKRDDEEEDEADEGYSE